MRLSRTYQILILCSVILVVYYSALFSPICFIDDNKIILYDAADTRLDQLFSILLSGGGYYRPLLFMTFVVDNYLWLLQESFMHLENVILHGINALLLYSVTERLAKRIEISPDNNAIPFIVSLLFILHPLATESVNWISGRTDPLSCLFLLLALKMLLDYIKAPTSKQLVLIQALYFFACLSKETAVFFIGPALLLATVLRSNEKRHNTVPACTILSSLKTNWLIKVSFILTTIAYFVLRHYASTTNTKTDRSLNKLTKYATQQTQESLWFDKFLEIFRSVGFYTKKIFIPWPLNFNIVQVSNWYILLGLISLTLLGYFCWRRRDLVATLMLSAFLIGSSALLVSIGKLAWTTYAERYLYIPLIFFIPASVLWLHEKIGGIRNGVIFRVVILIVCGTNLILTVQRNLLWMDSAAFYELNYRQAPNLPTTMRSYAFILQQEGQQGKAKKILERLSKEMNTLSTTPD